MNDVQRCHAAIEPALHVGQVDAQLAIDPIVTHPIPGGEQRVELDTLVVGWNENRAPRRQAKTRDSVIQRDSPAERPPAWRVEGEPLARIRVQPSDAPEAGERGIRGNRHVALATACGRCGCSFAVAGASNAVATVCATTAAPAGVKWS